MEAGRKQGKKKCPRCKSEQKFKGYRTRIIHTGRTGKIKIKRAYYTCTNRDCHKGQSPLDMMLGLSPKHAAAGKFEEKICHLSATMPFEQVQQHLEIFDEVIITETMIRETAERCGSAMIASEEKSAKEIGDEKADKLSINENATERLYIQADGGMVPIRAEKDGKEWVEYKENKVAVVFREEDIHRSPKGKCSIKKKRFTTSIGKGVAHFEILLRRIALLAGSCHAKTIIFISDGAEWIDQMRGRLFPNSIHILDWFHAEEHLWKCAKAIFGERSVAKISSWVEPLKALLWEGKAHEVCDRLLFEIKRHPKKETEIRELYTYYITRLDKMKYAEFRENGYFIGSGAVESANKYLVQQRLKQAGMKWTIEGASAVIKLREKIYEKSWVDTWGKKAVNFSH